MKYYFIKKLKVEYISLVDSPANRKGIVYKSENIFQKHFEIRKTDEEKRIVYGIVYSPNELDTQNMFTDGKVIEEAAHNFLKSGNTNKVDNQHNLIADVGFICESWITKEKDSVFENEPEGSWAVGIKIISNEMWEKVKSSEIKGISLYGTAVLEERNENELFKNLIKKFSKYFQTDDRQLDEIFSSVKIINEKIENLEKIQNEKIGLLQNEIKNHFGRIEKMEQFTKNSVQPGVIRKKTPTNYWI